MQSVLYVTMTQIDYNQRVSSRIKELRIRKNISQSYIAQSLGLTVSAYNRIENNKTQLTIHNLYQIATALKVGIEELLQLKTINKTPNKSEVTIDFSNEELVFSIDSDQIRSILNKAFKKN